MTAKGMKKFLGKAQDTLEALWPATIELNGASYKCACVGEISEGTLIDGGFAEDVDLVIRLSKKLHPTKPSDGSILYYNGKERRILRVPETIDSAWTIQCADLDAR